MNLFKINTLLKYDYLQMQICFKYDKYSIYNSKSLPKNRDWLLAMNEARKIVGYSTSFFNLRWLLSDEAANIALHLRKLIGSNHPLLNTVKNLIYDSNNIMQPWGLVVLLVSKAAGHSSNLLEIDQDKTTGVLRSQRLLAEITEMIRTSRFIHESLYNLKTFTKSNENLLFGNKISLLSGDYLLTKSLQGLAKLKNQEVLELMSTAVRDQSEAEFIGSRDIQNNALPTKPKQLKVNKQNLNIGDSSIKPIAIPDILGYAEAEWTLRNVLSAGSLLGKACQGTLKLAGHPSKIQEKGYLFGKHLALAWQAHADYKLFQGKNNGPFSLISAPVMYHLEYDPTLYIQIEKGTEDASKINYDLIYEAVLSGPALKYTKQLQKKHSKSTLHILKQFPKTDARQALKHIIITMKDE